MKFWLKNLAIVVFCGEMGNLAWASPSVCLKPFGQSTIASSQYAGHGADYAGMDHTAGTIVFSAERFSLNAHMPDLIPVDHSYHLWRVNADGSGLRRLTHGRDVDDGLPSWSPDGKSILFGSRRQNRIAVCVINDCGGHVRRIYAGPWDEMDQLAWSRDGRMVALVVHHSPLDVAVYLLYVPMVGRAVKRWKIADSAYFAWSPDSKRLYLGFEDGSGRIFDVATGNSVKVAMPIWGAVWLDNDTIFGTVPEAPDHPVDLVRSIDARGGLKWERTLTPSLEIQSEVPILWDERWYHVVNDTNHLFLQYHTRFANGGSYNIFRVTLPSMKAELFQEESRWCGCSADGAYVAAAQWYWVEHHRGIVIEDARVGSIYVTSICTGKLRAITWPLADVESGDWR